jgi:hypothetical protein
MSQMVEELAHIHTHPHTHPHMLLQCCADEAVAVFPEDVDLVDTGKNQRIAVP